LEPFQTPVHCLATANCPHCGTRLATEMVDDGTTVLCAACRHPFIFHPSTDLRRFSRKAVASLALGLASTLFWCLAGVPAVVLGVLALIEIRRQHDRLKGGELAIVGIVAACSLGLICTPILATFLMPAFQALRSGK